MTNATFFAHIYRTSYISVFTRVRYFSIAVILLVLATTVVRGEQVLLGDPALTAGVPGNGPISVPQIETWLDDEHNFTELTPVLPLGLSQVQARLPVSMRIH